MNFWLASVILIRKYFKGTLSAGKSVE